MRRTHSIAVVTILSVSLLFCGCQSVGTKAVAPEVLAEFAISGDTNHVTLPVRFHGEEYRFVLDTGATDTVFDDSFKDKLGKRFLWPKKATGAGGKEFKVEYFRARGHHAHLGPLDLVDPPLIRVCDLDALVSKAKRNFQGIIGMEFMAKYIVQIDFDNGKVTFFRGNKDTDLFSFLRPRENRHPEWGEPIPLKKSLFAHRCYVEARLPEDTSARFLIDSGWAAPDAMSGRLFENVHSSVTAGPKRENISPDFSLFSNQNAKLIKKFRVGSFEYRENLFQRNNESILGLPFLSRHLVTLDFPNNTMYLKKGGNFDKQPLVFLIEGLCKVRAEGFAVVEVDPDGPASEKGIKETDILVKVNGRDISSPGIAGFVEFLSHVSVPTDAEITFTFKHGDEMITVPISNRDVDANEN